MGALAEFVVTEQYKGLIHYLLTSMFPQIDADDFEEVTESIFTKMGNINNFKQFLSENYEGVDKEVVLEHAVQFVLIVENILLLRKLEE